MKSLLALFVTLVGTLLFAEDAPKPITYTGEVTGVVCMTCKDKIRTSLMKNLEGTISVDVKPGTKPDTQKLIIVSNSDHLNVGEAVTALGEYSKEYAILSLVRQGE